MPRAPTTHLVDLGRSQPFLAEEGFQLLPRCLLHGIALQKSNPALHPVLAHRFRHGAVGNAAVPTKSPTIYR